MGKRVLLNIPSVKKQWPLPSCMSCAVATALEAIVGGGWEASPLFLFYNSNRLAAGRKVMIGDVLRAAHRIGVCTEAQWPYNASNAKLRPPSSLYLGAERIDGAFEIASVDKVIQSIDLGRATVIQYDVRLLVAKGLPVGRLYGSHTSTIIGYDTAGYLIVRNSWGKEWGQDGDFELTNEEFMGPLIYGRIVVMRE